MSSLRVWSLAVVCLSLAIPVHGASRGWLENQRIDGSFPDLAEGFMYLDVSGNILIYGGIQGINFLDEMYLWNPKARMIRRIGTGPIGEGVSTFGGLRASYSKAVYVKLASAGSKVLMAFQPYTNIHLETNATLAASLPWPKLSVHLYDVSVQDGWLDAAGGPGVKGSSPDGMQGFGLAGANGKFYFYGGRKHTKSYMDELVVFDPDALTWSVLGTKNAPKVPLMLKGVAENWWEEAQPYSPPENQKFANDHLGISHLQSLAFLDGKLYFTNSTNIWYLDFETLEWRSDERLIDSDGYGTLLVCADQLNFVSCTDWWSKPHLHGIAEKLLDQRRNLGDGTVLPSAACYSGEIFCSADSGEGAGTIPQVPVSVDVATGKMVTHAVRYARTRMQKGPRELSAVQERGFGSSVFITIKLPVSWDPRNTTLSAVDVASGVDPAQEYEVYDEPGALVAMAAVGDKVVACTDTALYLLKPGLPKLCKNPRDWEGNAVYCDVELTRFSDVFEEMAAPAHPNAPPGCEILGVLDNKPTVWLAGKLYTASVDGEDVTWTQDGEYEEVEASEEWSLGFMVGLSTWTGPYLYHWPAQEVWGEAALRASKNVGRLFDMESRKWVLPSDPGFFREMGSEEMFRAFDDIQGYDNKIYMWMHSDQAGGYRSFGSDMIVVYDIATDTWADITTALELPDTLADTSGALDQPWVSFVTLEGSLMVLDRAPFSNDHGSDGGSGEYFDWFKMPTADKIQSTGNLWADLYVAFDGDTVCVAAKTELRNTIRFGAGGMPASIEIKDCASTSVSARRTASAVLSVAAGKLLICSEVDGCSRLTLTDVVLACGSAEPQPSVLQVLGRGASLSLSGVTVQACSAYKDGGAVLSDNAIVSVQASRFESTRAAVAGGALYLRGGQTSIAASHFISCSARLGGAITAVPLTATVVGQGGAEFVTFVPELNISGTLFSRNSAEAGGAVHVTQARLSISGTTFEHNTATSETGGALHLVDSHVSMAAAAANVARNNSAWWGGGVVFWQTVAPVVDADSLCSAGGNDAKWGPCIASNAQAIAVSSAAPTLYTGITLDPITVQMRDFYGQTLTTEQDAIFDVVASLNYSLDPDPDVQVTGTLFQKAQRGATVFDNINVQVRFSEWDLEEKRTRMVSKALLYFRSTDPYSGFELNSEIVTLEAGAGDAVCPQGYILEVNDVRTDEGTETALGRCVECGFGTYSLSPLSSPSAGASNPSCFTCPVGAGDACLGGATFNSSEPGTWEVEGGAWRLTACPAGFILVRDPARLEQDQCVECASPTFSRGEVVYEEDGDGGGKIAARAVEAAGKCETCPPNAECNGGTTVIPTVGFWSVDGNFTPPPPERLRRAEAGAEEGGTELEMYKCPANACLGNNQCNEGHYGRVCALCKPNHAKTPAGCQLCEGDVGAAKGVAAVFGTIALLILWYWFAWRPMLQDVWVFQMFEKCISGSLSCWFKAKDQQGEMEGKVGKVAGWIGDATSVVSKVYDKFKGDLQGFVKIIISFYQVVSSFASTFTVEWPAGLVRVFDGAKFFQLDFISLPGPACLTYDWTYKARLLVYTVVPILVVLLISMPVSILFVMGGMTGATAKWDKTVSLFWYSLLFFLYVIYPMVSVQCLSTFSCHNIGPAGNWLVADYRVWCPNDDTGGFLFGWSLAFTFVFPIGIPLFFAGIMFYFKIPGMAKQKLAIERLQGVIDLYRRETGSAEGASLVRHVESMATRVGEEVPLAEGMREVFELIDANKDGVVSLAELRAYMLGARLCSPEDFKRALPLKKAFKRVSKGKRLSFEGFVELCDALDRCYSSFSGRDVPRNLTLNDKAEGRLSKSQLELLANHEWDFSEEGGPDTSQETLLRNMADGGDGHRRFSLEDEEELAEIEAAEAAPEEEEEAPAPQSRGELEAKVLEIAAELESLGKVVLPALGWDGVLEGEEAALDRIGFLFTMYEVKFWYFELVEMVRKLLITAVLVFVFPRTPAQLAAGLVISFGSLIIYYSCRPFLSERLDGLQIFALITQCINLFYGIMLIVQTATVGTTGSSNEDGLITGIVVVLNCGIVAVPFINMATEKLASFYECATTVLPCCKLPDGAGPSDEEEAVEGDARHYGRFRGSSTFSGDGIMPQPTAVRHPANRDSNPITPERASNVKRLVPLPVPPRRGELSDPAAILSAPRGSTEDAPAVTGVDLTQRTSLSGDEPLRAVSSGKGWRPHAVEANTDLHAPLKRGSNAGVDNSPAEVRRDSEQLEDDDEDELAESRPGRA